MTRNCRRLVRGAWLPIALLVAAGCKQGPSPEVQARIDSLSQASSQRDRLMQEVAENTRLVSEISRELARVNVPARALKVSGDSPDTLSARAGTFTRASSRLISLTRRVFSATSCINRSRWDDAWDRLSMRACTSGDGPCLHPAAMSSAIGSHAPRARRRQLRVIFLNLLPGLA